MGSTEKGKTYHTHIHRPTLVLARAALGSETVPAPSCLAVLLVLVGWLCAEVVSWSAMITQMCKKYIVIVGSKVNLDAWSSQRDIVQGSGQSCDCNKAVERQG